MIRVDPSPILFYFFFFDPSWSESIRVDPTRTGGPSWSGPTFLPAFCCKWAHIELNQTRREISYLLADPLFFKVQKPSN